MALTGDQQLSYDLVHDAIEKLILKKFVINKMAYTKTIMRNKFYDILKSKSYTQNSLLEDLPIDEFLDDKLDHKMAMQKIMKKLKASEREILYLWAIEEYSTQEISQLTGIPKGTITSKIKRLRDKLQQEVKYE